MEIMMTMTQKTENLFSIKRGKKTEIWELKSTTEKKNSLESLNSRSK